MRAADHGLEGTDFAPDGQVWVCGACGKTSPTRYGFDVHSRNVAQLGWDESCMLNAVLCFTGGPPWTAVPADETEGDSARMLSPEEILRAVRHYTDDQQVVVVFEHGTVVIGAKNVTAAVSVMRAYNVPRDGEGSAFGDMVPFDMDDGNSLVTFIAVAEGQAVFVYRPGTEGEVCGDAARSSTEVFPGATDMANLSICLGARRRRSLDAKELKVVAQWDWCIPRR